MRRIENRRDDPLVDAALRRLSENSDAASLLQQEPCMTQTPRTHAQEEQQRISAECSRALRRLVETGAVLAVAQDMEMAGGEIPRGDGGAPPVARLHGQR